MKRFLLFFLMAMVVGSLIFAGCAGPSSSPTTTTAPAATTSKPPSTSTSAPSSAPATTTAPAPTTSQASTQKAADFYKGKTVTLYVPSDPGSGLDSVARIIAPLMGRELGATVVVDNRSGGAYTIPINLLYEKPDTEGLSMSEYEGGATLSAQLLGLENCRYDLRKMNVLANFSASDGIAAVSADSPYKSMADLLKATKLVAAATGPTTPTGMAAKIILEAALKLPVKVVTGYASAPATYTAVVQKEADITLGLYSAAASLVSAGKLKIIFVWQPQRMKTLPDVPTVYEELDKLGKLTPEVKGWIDLIINLTTVSRGLVMSPGIPPEKVQYLRGVMNKVMQDPTLPDSFNKVNAILYPLSGEQAAEKINQVLNTDPSQVAQLKKLLTGG